MSYTDAYIPCLLLTVGAFLLALSRAAIRDESMPVLGRVFVGIALASNGMACIMLGLSTLMAGGAG